MIAFVDCLFRRCMTLPIVAGAVLLSGCGVLQSPVPVRDDDSPVVAVRAAIYPKSWGQSEALGPGIELGYESYRARDIRSLDATDSITVNGLTVSGPDTVRQEASLRMAHLAYTHRFRFGQLGVEPFVGLARFNARFRVEPTLSTLRPVSYESRRGPVGGLTLRWHFNEWLAAEGRLMLLDVFEEDSNSAEIALALRPLPNLALRLGYSEREHVLDNGFISSRVEIRARGPSISAIFEF